MNVGVRLRGIVGRSVARKRAHADGGDVAHASPEWTNTGVARECA
jgi:hypothetical protein